MTIVSKDGSVYLLKSPNPLVKQQEKWDLTKLVFHNFNWEEIREKAEIKKTAPKKEPEQKTVKISTEPKENYSPPKEQPEQKQITPKEDEKTFDFPLIKYKTISYCLPAIVEKKQDNFYGESWGRITYGNKFTFPSVITNSTDFSFEFWTSDPHTQISEKSIIYPFSYEVYNERTNSYDKVPYDEYRWWKVNSKERKEGGWLFSAVPSEIQPDFSD